MVMGDEDLPKLTEDQPGPNDLARDAVSAINDIDFAAGNDRLGAAETIGPNPRSAGCAE
jgi:hypothetical protein